MPYLFDTSAISEVFRPRRIEEDVLPTFTVLPFDYEAARTYGRLRAELSAAGRPVGDADLMIAAVAVRFGLEVVTANIRHFEPVPGLTVRAVHR